MRSLVEGFQSPELLGPLELIFGRLYARRGCLLIEHGGRRRLVVVQVRV